jgi:hypothetical protein
MGGKSSSDEKEKKKSSSLKSSIPSSSFSSKEESKVISSYTVQGLTGGNTTILAPITTVKPGQFKGASAEEARRSLVETLVEMILGAESVRSLAGDIEYNQRGGKFTKHCVDAISSHDPEQLRRAVAEITKTILEETKKNPKYDELLIFLLSLITGFKKMRLPTDSKQPQLTIQAFLEQMLDNGVEDIEGTLLESPCRSLCLDICNQLGIQHSDEDSLSALVGHISANKSSLAPLKLSPENLPLTCISLQPWIFDQNEELEEDERVCALVLPFRQFASKALKDNLFNIKAVTPSAPPIISNLRLQTFQLGLNLSLGRLSFAPDVFQGRLCKTYFQCYIMDRSVRTRYLHCLNHLSVGGQTLPQEALLPYMPTFGKAVEKLATVFEDMDIVNDFDAVFVCTTNDNHYAYFTKKDKICLANSGGNAQEFKSYFSREPNFQDEGRVRILMKTKPIDDGILDHCFLITCGQSDTFGEVIKRKFNQIINETEGAETVSADYINFIMSNLVISTQASLNKKQFEEAKSATKKLKLNWNTPIADILTELRGKDTAYTSQNNLIDFIIYVNPDNQEYFNAFSPASIDVSLYGCDTLTLKLDLSALFNMQLMLSGYTQECCEGFTEYQVRDLLPNVLYVDLWAIKNLVEIPRELSVDCVSKAIQDQGIAISQEYKAMVYHCNTLSGMHYAARIGQGGLVKATVNGEVREKPIEMLTPALVNGVLFERKTPQV